MRYSPLLLVPFLLLLAACGGPTEVAPLMLTGFSPKEGFPGATVTITGAQLGSDASRVVVLFNGTDTARVLSVTPTTIVAEVPATSVSPATIDVYVNGVRVEGLSERFTVRSIDDIVYDRASVMIGGLKLRYTSVQHGFTEEGVTDYVYSTSYGRDSGDGHVADGKLRIASYYEDAASSRNRSTEIVLGSAPLRLASVRIQEVAGEWGIGRPPGGLESTTLHRILLEDVPFTLRSNGEIYIRLTGEELRSRLREVYRKTDVTSSEGTGYVETTGIESLDSSTSWTIRILPK